METTTQSQKFEKKIGKGYRDILFDQEETKRCSRSIQGEFTPGGGRTSACWNRAGLEAMGKKGNNERKSKKYRQGDETEAGQWVKNRCVCGQQLAYDYDIGRWGKVKKD